MLHFREFPLLNTPSLFRILLQTARHNACGLADCAQRLKSLLEMAGENPPVASEEVTRRMAALRDLLLEARLLTPAGDELFRITQRGLEALERHPGGFDTADLMEYPEFAAYIGARSSSAPSLDPHARQYDEGYEAYRAGQRPADNPYPAETIDHLAWENGWCEALDEDAP